MVSLWLGVVLIGLLLVSQPIELRLWRAGRLSDRAVTMLLLAQFPMMVLIGIAATGPLDAGRLFTVAAVALPALIAYRWMLSFVREKSPRSN